MQSAEMTAFSLILLELQCVPHLMIYFIRKQLFQSACSTAVVYEL